VNGIPTTDFLTAPSIIGQSELKNITVKEGDNVRLRCVATGSPKPTIVWQKLDTSTVPMGSWRGDCIKKKELINSLVHYLIIIFIIFTLEEVVTGNVINITKVNRLHMGRYKCIADNGVPPSAVQYYSIETHCKYFFFRLQAKQ
jgi:hypothetical protein